MIEFKKRDIVYRRYEPFLHMIVDIVMIICATFLVVTSYFHSTQVSGYSMENTLHDGDIILIDTLSYKLREPRRFEMIVFETDDEDTTGYYVKRIIGLPGETVMISGGKVIINGTVLDDVIDIEIYNFGVAKEPITLKQNEYFVLGDNRNNSDDSRFSNIGMVNFESIIGKAWLDIYPLPHFSILNTGAQIIEKKE